MILSIDIETYSEADLSKTGVYAYAQDPSFEILLLAYAFDDDPVQIVDLASGESLPMLLEDALTDPDVIKSAYNANFERTCLSVFTGQEMPPEQWYDTMILAAEMGLPKSLKDVGQVLGLSEEEQKMKEGRNLIQFFSKPCKATKANGGRTRNLPEHAPDKWATFKLYNLRDVETERTIRRRLDSFEVHGGEWQLWCVDQNINDRGVLLDRSFAENAARIDAEIKEELLQEARQISGMENPKSPVQIKRWIRERTGVEVESLNKAAMSDVIEQVGGDPTVMRFLDIRKELSKTSTAKYDAMLRCSGSDDRIRGLTQFYGAGRTGRWAGRLVQMQNLPQNKMPDEDLDVARQLVKDGERDVLEILFEPAQALSELIRTSFIPKPGHKFIVSDFSAIEARVLAWMAGESWRLDVFNSHGKIYEASAEQMFNLPPGSVKKGDPMRQKGKIAELALGYGGSVGALKAMGALEMGLHENELKPLVDSWRAANRRITQFWWNVDAAARRCIQTRFTQELQLGIRFRMEGMYLRVRLPSGRELSYVKPKFSEEDGITFEGMIQAGGWGRQQTYGPKLVENIVQAVSRDCLAESMIRLEEAGIPIVFHVHDEVICEVPEDSWTAEEVAEIMGQPIAWADCLPLRADAYECHYYRKD